MQHQSICLCGKDLGARRHWRMLAGPSRHSVYLTHGRQSVTKSHTMLLVALLLVGEVSPLFLSMPQRATSLQDAGGGRGEVVTA